MLLDGDHLLLADKAVPAAQRLGVVRRICVIGSHVLAHDLGGVARDVEAGLEPVLQPHAGDGLRADAAPCAVMAPDQLIKLGDLRIVGHETSLRYQTLAGRWRIARGYESAAEVHL